jgi:type I restriction enzyme M protein
MTQTKLQNIEQLESDLWAAADQLRANSKLTSSDYCMPVLGIIFLRHATNRYDDAVQQIAADQAAGKMPRRTPIKADFLKRRALMLPREARYDTLRGLPKGTNLGTALVKAMDAIERDFEPLLNVLPKDYDRFENDLLEDILRIFDSDTLCTASGDVFGRIYEYFLMKFAMQGAQDNGEFFTPPSLVQTIVNVIEPDHGIVCDLACGSAGMFVQSSHFIERHGQDASHRVSFFGQEKTATTIRLAKMNLAVHGLEGNIREANTFYEDVHRLKDGKPLFGNCDFVMANPPFNVDMVDADKVKDDRRLPFGLPGVNKAKKVSNGNYLWISYFYSYLGPKGRAGFVMSSQASGAAHGEAEVRGRCNRGIAALHPRLMAATPTGVGALCFARLGLRFGLVGSDLGHAAVQEQLDPGDLACVVGRQEHSTQSHQSVRLSAEAAQTIRNPMDIAATGTCKVFGRPAFPVLAPSAGTVRAPAFMVRYPIRPAARESPAVRAADRDPARPSFG